MNYIDAFKLLDNFERLLEIAIDIESNLTITSEQCKRLFEALQTIDY